MELNAVLLSVEGALTDGAAARPGAAELIAALDERGVASAALRVCAQSDATTGLPYRGVGGVAPLLEDDDFDHRDRRVSRAAFGEGVDVVDFSATLGQSIIWSMLSS